MYNLFLLLSKYVDAKDIFLYSYVTPRERRDRNKVDKVQQPRNPG